MKIRAALARNQNLDLSIEEVDLSDPAAGEILVRIVATGICHTDLTLIQGMQLPIPLIAGHEGAGIVERIGAGVTKVRPGDHVVMTATSCGECPRCSQGDPAYCLNFMAANLSGGSRADGTCSHTQEGRQVFGRVFGQSSLAGHVIADERNVIKVAPDLPFELIGPLGCGILTGAATVFNTLKVTPGSSIAIFGAGTVGLAALMAARISGATTIIAVDLKDNRLDIARELGATHVFNAGAVDAVSEIKALGGVDYAVEATGFGKVMEQAIAALAAGGTAALVGVAHGQSVTIDPTLLQSSGLTVKGSLMSGRDCVPDFLVAKLIAFWRAGQLPIEKLIRTYRFDEINQAISDICDGRTVKPVLVFDETEVN